MMLETWADVQDWVKDAKHKHKHWTVAMILDGTDQKAQVPDGDLDEKGRWIDNLNLMMPNNLNSEEIASSLMSLASMYLDQKDMAIAFTSIGRMLTVINGDQNALPKESMH
tara:strand:- start:282 stop:614 length:333 start_codon:yes stop_codon:yes gene_type:complete